MLYQDQFSLELIQAIHNHQPLTAIQKTFIWLTVLVPLPFTWKLWLYTNYLQATHSLPTFLPLMLGIFLLYLFLLALFKLLTLRRRSRTPLVSLEITPPAQTTQSAYSTQQLLVQLHALTRPKSLVEKLLGQKETCTLEIVATKEEGIRYLLVTHSKDVSLLAKSLRSFLPGVQIKEVTDYFPNFCKNPSRVISFKLVNHFAYPLQEQKILTEHDPIAYLTGQMTQLQADELLAWQLTFTPVDQFTHRSKKREISRVSNTILNNGNVFGLLSYSSLPGFLSIPLHLLSFMVKLLIVSGYLLLMLPLTLAVQIISMVSSNGSNMGPQLPSIPFWGQPKGPVQLTPAQQEIAKQIQTKVNQQLFEASVRLFISSSNTTEVIKKERGFTASLATFANPSWQAIRPVSSFLSTPSFVRKLENFLFSHRLLGWANNLFLSASEIADLYHFPYTPTTQTEDLVTNLSPLLSAPLSLKQTSHDLALTFANNSYGGRDIPIGLTNQERRRHVLIQGGTDMGKTTLLKTMVMEDIVAGRGLCVIDPHGDLIEDILLQVPKERIKDVILFDPADTNFPLGMNILVHLPGTIDLEADCDRIGSAVVDIFSKLTDEKYFGPRMEHILRNAVLTALHAPTPTLLTVQQLLTDRKTRKLLADSLSDPILKQFWQQEFALFGSFQKAQAISPITNKLGKFLTTPLSRNILLQEQPKLFLDQVMDEGKILLCNLSKGKLGEDKSAFFGSLLTNLVQLATYRRVYKPESQRRDFYLYIDEFQNFATPTFTEILSEARKYRLYTILALQSLSQISDPHLVQIILANVGTIICFKTANSMDENYLLPAFTPAVKAGDLANLPPHRFYIKIQGNTPELAFSGETIVKSYSQSAQTKEKIIAQTREIYATPRLQVENRIRQIVQSPLAESSGSLHKEAVDE